MSENEFVDLFRAFAATIQLQQIQIDRLAGWVRAQGEAIISIADPSEARKAPDPEKMRRAAREIEELQHLFELEVPHTPEVPS